MPAWAYRFRDSDWFDFFIISDGEVQNGTALLSSVELLASRLLEMGFEKRPCVAGVSKRPSAII